MITNTGRQQHLNVIAGTATRFADKFVVGSSNAALDPNAQELDFGWGECLVTGNHVDYANSQVIFYGTMPAEFEGQIAEIGLATMNSEFIETGRDINISFYFSDQENWLYDDDEKIVYDSENSLMGPDDVKIVGAEPGEKLWKSMIDDTTLHNKIKMRISAESAGSIVFRLYSSETTYVAKTIELNPGENIIKFTIEDMAMTGEYRAAELGRMEFEIVDPGTYTFDAVVFTGTGNSGLVTRSPVAVPKKKIYGNTMELEYAVMLGV